MEESPMFDAAVRRQVLLERLKVSEIKGFSKAFRDIERYIQSAIAGSGELNAAKKSEIRRFLNETHDEINRRYAEGVAGYIVELEETGGVYAAFEATDIEKLIAGGIAIASPTAKEAFTLALNRPMSHSGETLKEFLAEFAETESDRLVNAIRRGSINGRTNQQIIRQIIGTKAAKYKDGLLEASRRSTEALVRTATQHVASVSRQATWESNPDVINRYQWVSTLDSKTTLQCQGLDGRIFEVGKGPTPPIHYRCRSTTIPVLSEEYQWLSAGRTRSAEFGPVNAKEDFYGWLKNQDEAVQVEALGEKRAKLFRDGGISAERFKSLSLDRNFETITLAEMRRKEPEAFKRAGLDG